MNKYTCVKCLKEFKREINYTKHMNTKHSETLIKKKIVKPILKWVGGKTQIIEKIISNFPSHINNYHEIFLGGGSVLLSVLQYKQNGIITIEGNIYASDINEPLIYVYKNIQTNHICLYEEIQTLINIKNVLFHPIAVTK